MKNKFYIGWKTFWEKEKLLVTSNFSFSNNVFHSYTCTSLVCQNAALCDNGLIYYSDLCSIKSNLFILCKTYPWIFIYSMGWLLSFMFGFYWQITKWSCKNCNRPYKISISWKSLSRMWLGNIIGQTEKF